MKRDERKGKKNMKGKLKKEEKGRHSRQALYCPLGPLHVSKCQVQMLVLYLPYKYFVKIKWYSKSDN